MKGVLFDLDGVIADTSIYHFQAWRKLIKDHFSLSLPNEFEQQTKGVSRTDSLKAILNFLNIDVSKEQFEQLAAEKNQTYQKLLNNLTPKDILPGIQKLISDFKSHDVKISLASASLNAPLILEKLDLWQDFDAIANPNEVKFGKPAPDIFLQAAKEIDAQPKDCVGIEDSIAGIDAINRAGSLSVGVGAKEELNKAKLLFPTTADLNYDQIETAWEQASIK